MISATKKPPQLIKRFSQFLAVLTLSFIGSTAFSQDIPFFDQTTLIQGSDYSQISAISVTDYDGDNDQDVLLFDKATQTINVLHNDGLGNFGNPKIIGQLPTSLASISNIYTDDFNGDDLIDILVGNYLYIQSDDNTFNPSEIEPSLIPNSFSFTLYGDLDNDNDLDVIIGEGRNGWINYYKNDGLGNFEFADRVMNDFYRAPKLVDLNNDGLLDLLTSDSRAYFNSVDGLFENTDLNSDYIFLNASTSDLDGDGDMDFVSYQRGLNSKLSIFYNDGSGNGQRAEINETELDGAINAVTIVDVNGDIAPDIIASSRIMDRTFLYLNDGLGGFGSFKTISTTNGLFTNQENIFDYGDVDGDGINEIIFVSIESDKIIVFDDLDGQVTTKTINATPHYSPIEGIKTFDINQDGIVEIIPIGGGGASIYQIDSEGIIQPNPIEVIQDKGIFEMSFVDFDDDNDIDIVVGVDSTNLDGLAFSFSVSLYENDGNQNFSKQSLLEWDESQSTLNSIPRFKDAFDFDNDGDIDLILTLSGYSVIYLQDNGEFTLQKDFEIFDLFYATSSDEDDNGIKELYGKDFQSGSSAISYFEYDDEIINGQATVIYDGETSSHLKIADFSMDGISDFFMYNDGAINVILSNNDPYDYRETPIFVGGDRLINSTFQLISAGDIDNDGDPDVITSYYDFSTSTSYLTSFINDGIGTFGGKFEEVGHLELTDYPSGSSLTASHINDDNKIDVLLSKTESNEIVLLLNSFGQVIKPEIVKPLSPSNESISTKDTLSFRWEASARAESYTLNISTDSLFNDDVFEVSINAPDTTVAPDLGLMESSDYFFRIRANNSGGSSDWSDVFKFTLVTSVSINDDNESIPDSYFLSQNFPNPFNPTTTITYGLARSGNIRIQVFNVLGQMVSELVDGYQNAGVHSINFDASKLSSGVYIYQIKSDGFSLTKRMLLIK